MSKFFKLHETHWINLESISEVYDCNCCKHDVEITFNNGKELNLKGQTSVEFLEAFRKNTDTDKTGTLSF